MPQIELTPGERARQRADAHHLNPVVIIGRGGLSAAVRAEADAALSAHGLIKIRVLEGDHAERAEMLRTLADGLNAAPIQHIGKLLVLWRPLPEKERVVDEDRRPGPKTVKVLDYSRRGGQRPHARRVRLMGNERITPGGKVKKARRTQRSTKKQRGRR